MNARLPALAVALFPLFPLFLLATSVAGCGSETDSSTHLGDPMPTEIPAADGLVRTRDLVTVMDTGRPEVCLGPVAESYPPQCSGPELVGWDWADHDAMFETRGDVRWGTFALTGRFDGTAMTVTEAIPGALYDPAMPTSGPTPTPGTTYSEAELVGISQEAGRLPGVQTTSPGEGHVFVDVVYDDGSLQAWVDEEYGENVVILTSALVGAER